MIIEQQGNCLDIAGGIIIHGCNAQGAMNSGIAKEVRARFPGAWKAYAEAYATAINQGGLSHIPVGSISIYQHTDDLFIVNAITQLYYGRDPDVKYLKEEGLQAAFATVSSLIVNGANTPFGKAGLDHGIHFPKIGCGLAHGKWDVVSKIIEETVDPIVEKILWIYEP